jgi:hypothetical protein
VKVILAGVDREWGRSGLYSNRDRSAISTKCSAALPHPVHDKVAGDFYLTRWIEEVGLFLVGERTGRG